MQSPWRENERSSGEDLYHDQQFGHILERSTSAPPVSTEPQHLRFMENQNDGGSKNNFLFGNGTNGDAALFSPSGRDSAPLTSEELFLGDQAGRATAPGFSNSILSDAFAPMGNGLSQPTLPVSRSASVGFAMDGHMQRSSYTSEAPQLSRSQSAAPVNRPPPGLGNLQAAEEPSRQYGQRRSASAGLLNEEHHDPSNAVLASLGLGDSGDGGAVRPAPKRLMDLIQEDTPPPSASPVYANLGLNRSHTAAPYYDRNDDLGYERSRTASPLGARYQVDSQFEQQERNNRQEFRRPQPSRYQQQPQQMQEGMNGMTQQMDRLQVSPGGQQFSQQRMTSPDMQQQTTGQQYVSIPVSQMQRGQRGQHHEVLHAEPSRPQARSVYTMPQQPQQQHQQSRQQYDGGQQQGYYTHSPRSVESNMPSNAGLTPAVLPNGQTVYINTNPQYGGYTVQYSAPPSHQQHPQHSQHGQMMHQQHQQQDYMSVMPMQNGGQQYWQDGNGMGPGAVIMNQQVQMQQGSPSRRGGREANDRSPTNQKNAPKGARRGGQPGGGRRDEARGSKGGGSGSSAILDEFRSTKNREWTMLDIKGHVVEFCQDQNGSRFIQQRLEIGNASEQQVVMAEVLPAVRQLRNDVFGNYVVQKLLQFGTPQMKAELRDTLKGEILPLSLQMYGCRVVQKALEALEEDDLPKLLTEFHHNVLSCIHDQNGNHVIQKCIEVMSTKAKDAYSLHDGERAQFFGAQIDFIINDVLDNVTSLSCHPYGCRVLQRILEHCVEPKKLLALDAISKSHRVLLDDQYGNYVIQHVLQYGRHEDRDSILEIVVANGLLQLSKQKFASNVVEKLLKYGTPTQRNALVREMLQVVDDPNTGGSSVVLLMVRDAYANYVVQTTLDVVSEGEEKRLLLEELNRHSAQLRQYTFAKHIVTKLSS